jgi:hypothetical protein
MGWLTLVDPFAAPDRPVSCQGALDAMASLFVQDGIGSFHHGLPVVPDVANGVFLFSLTLHTHRSHHLTEHPVSHRARACARVCVPDVLPDPPDQGIGLAGIPGSA